MISCCAAIGYEFLGQAASRLYILAQPCLNPGNGIPIRPNMDFAINHLDQNGIAIRKGKSPPDIDRQLKPAP